jgi:5-methylcytosine-specific restriction protein A|tara:strand:- start:556 stop:1296 length:741 start_codon:yes stop_codon:yes gene_type:complete
MFQLGKKYLRKHIINTYGGQSRSGITTPSKHPLIFLFTSSSGKEFGYDDGWTDDGIFEICGEGQIGDMRFVRGNKAIYEHKKNGKELHLFEAVSKGYVRYVSQMSLMSFRKDHGKDKDGNMRERIIFQLIPESTFNENELTSSHLADGNKTVKYSTTYERNPKNRRDAIKIHGLSCMACGFNFEKSYGEHGKGFIHVHHNQPLHETGETIIDPKKDLIVLCPNCHAMVHRNKKYTLSLDELRELLN